MAKQRTIQTDLELKITKFFKLEQGEWFVLNPSLPARMIFMKTNNVPVDEEAEGDPAINSVDWSGLLCYTARDTEVYPITFTAVEENGIHYTIDRGASK